MHVLTAYAHDILTRNWYQKLVPVARFWYQFLVPETNIADDTDEIGAVCAMAVIVIKPIKTKRK